MSAEHSQHDRQPPNGCLHFSGSSGFLPCPFCGSEDIELNENKNGYEVFCTDCLAHTMCSCSREWVIKCWNSRTQIDRDEAFWQKIRTLPDEVKSRADIQRMLLCKSKVQQLNRDIEDAIELRLAGWTASMPSGELEPERVFSWQWRRPGPKGGRLFLSTQQAVNALRKGEGSLTNVPALAQSGGEKTPTKESNS